MTDPIDSRAMENAGDIKRILVASDLTAYTDRAFDRAVMLAEEHQASLHLLHVVDPGALPESYVQRDIREATRNLEEELRDSGIDRRLELSVKVMSGDADKIIIDEADAMQADLIVMGLSHSAATFTGMFRGTTVDKVVRSADRPVLVVKKRPWRSYGKVAAAVDLAEPSRRALDIALRALPKAEFTIIHGDESSLEGSDVETTSSPLVVERRRQIEDLVAARFAAVGRDGPGTAGGPALTFEGGKVSDALQKHIGLLAPDLVVLGTHGRMGISRLFLGSVAETLLEVLPQDVLVVRA